MLQNNQGGRKEVQEGRDICIPKADSCCCVAETTILKSNYPPKKKVTKEGRGRNDYNQLCSDNLEAGDRA